MGKRVSRKVKCPFYLKHDGSKIVCEGVSDNNTIHLAFEDSKERARYMISRCNRIQACQSCLVHNMLYKKWEDSDE